MTEPTPAPDQPYDAVQAHIEGTSLIIDHAPAQVVFSAAALQLFGAATPVGALKRDGDVATITAANRTVRYQLGEPDAGGFIPGTLLDQDSP